VPLIGPSVHLVWLLGPIVLRTVSCVAVLVGCLFALILPDRGAVLPGAAA